MVSIPDPAVLAFKVADAIPIIQGIFQNDIARTLWLGIKFSHLVDQHFNQTCLDVASVIEAYPDEITAKWLDAILQKWRLLGPNDTFGEVLLPYVKGEKAIEWRELLE